MSDAKRDVLNMINKKQKRIKEIRARGNTKIGPYAITTDLIKAIENVSQSAQTPVDFDQGINAIVRIFNQRMCSIDPEVQIEILWNDVDKINDWKGLCIEGVNIKWSSFYLGKNPLSSRELKIDIATLFMEGFLN